MKVSDVPEHVLDEMVINTLLIVAINERIRDEKSPSARARLRRTKREYFKR